MKLTPSSTGWLAGIAVSAVVATGIVVTTPVPISPPMARARLDLGEAWRAVQTTDWVRARAFAARATRDLAGPHPTALAQAAFTSSIDEALARSLSLEGRMSWNLGFADQAKQLWEESLRHNTEADALLGLAEIDRDHGLSAAAVEKIARAGRVTHQNYLTEHAMQAAGFNALAELQLSEANYSEAITNALSATHLRPGDPTAYIIMAKALEKQGLWQQSLATLSGPVLEYSCDALKTRFEIESRQAGTLQSRQRNAAITNCLTSALTRNPSSMHIKVQLGWAFIKIGDFRRAQEAFTEVLTSRYRNPSALLGQAQVSFELGDFAHARALLMELLASPFSTKHGEQFHKTWANFWLDRVEKRSNATAAAKK